MKPTAKIIAKVRRGVQNVTYGNPLYQKILASGEAPSRLAFTMPDPWPGEAQAGLALATGARSMFETGDNTSLRHAAAVLRNLRAVGTEAARQASVRLIDGWLRHYDSWDEIEWSPDILGERIAAWIGFYEFYAPAASPEFTAQLTASLFRQWKHLSRALPPGMNGPPALQALRGLIYGGLNFPDGDTALGLACDMLQRVLATEILPDGGHISRNPSALFQMLQHLVDMRACLHAAAIMPPPELDTAIGSMVPALKFFRHGDGGMSLFHGSAEETPLLIDAVLTQAGARSRFPRRLPDAGYERLAAGRSLLLADVGAPPPRGYDRHGHAGLLSFEFSHGRERLIVNCGPAPKNDGGGDPGWRLACAATAAHSTLTIEDTNACGLDAEGGVEGSVNLSALRYEQDGVHGLDLAHDGYRGRYGVTHQRVLRLANDGEVLEGRDTMHGPARRDFTLRWHLHPLVQASMSQGGQTALLRLPSGSGWRLRVEGGDLGLESSVYCGGGVPRRSLHLKASGRTRQGETAVVWRLMREKKG
jgi:uncharacterized heparinase superfamily protein